MPLLGSYKQQVGEVMDYYIDYTDWFSTRKDIPASFSASAESGIVLTQFDVDTTAKLARVVVDSTASVDGADAKVTVVLTTTSGIVKEDDFVVKVREV